MTDDSVKTQGVDQVNRNRKRKREQRAEVKESEQEKGREKAKKVKGEFAHFLSFQPSFSLSHLMMK